MTGEMHKSEMTRENFPLFFAAADKIPGSTVRSFDHYQGPYIHVPDVGTVFLTQTADRIGFRWYNTLTDCVSAGFLEDNSTAEAVEAFVDLVKGGGTKLQRDVSGEVVADAIADSPTDIERFEMLLASMPVEDIIEALTGPSLPDHYRTMIQDALDNVK